MKLARVTLLGWDTRNCEQQGYLSDRSQPIVGPCRRKEIWNADQTIQSKSARDRCFIRGAQNKSQIENFQPDRADDCCCLSCVFIIFVSFRSMDVTGKDNIPQVVIIIRREW
jgi:hypothetical protein